MYLGIPEKAVSAVTGARGYMTPASALSCTSFTYDAATYWSQYHKSHAEALIAASRGNVKVVPGVNWDTAASHVYNSQSTLVNEQVDSSFTSVSHDEGRTRVKSRAKDFEAAKREGKIVFNPLRAYKCEAGAGSNPVEPTYLLYRDYFMSYPGELTQLTTGCRKAPVRPFDQKSGRFLYESPQSLVRYKWYSAQGMQPTSPDLLKGVAIAVGHHLDGMTPSTELVTQTRARANEGLLDLYTSLAESPETVGMIFDLLKTVVRGWRRTSAEALALAKKFAGDPKKITDAVASLWLQWRYGIMPVYYDVRGLLAYLGVGKAEYLTVRSKSVTPVSVKLPGFDEFSLDVTERCVIKNRLGVESTKMEQFLRQDFTVTAWELVPLSFLIDWFISVGDFLASLRAPQASVQEAGMYSWRCKTSVSVPFTGGFNVAELAPDYYRATPINPSSHTGLTFRFGMNFQRTLDALALSWSIFLKTNRR